MKKLTKIQHAILQELADGTSTVNIHGKIKPSRWLDIENYEGKERLAIEYLTKIGLATHHRKLGVSITSTGKECLASGGEYEKPKP